MATVVVRMMGLVCFLFFCNIIPVAPIIESWKWLPAMAAPVVIKAYTFYDEQRASQAANLPNWLPERLSIEDWSDGTVSHSVLKHCRVFYYGVFSTVLSLGTAVSCMDVQDRY
jgi:hypothetical protein